MAKATIITKTGDKITIEVTADEVKQLITLLELKEIPAEKETGEGKREAGLKKKTVTNAILRLKGSGYFNRRRNLIEIQKDLAAQGFIYPVTTLSGILLKLVQRQALHREEQGKKWYYVK